MSERLTTTIKHFKDGVTSMGLTAARHSIESWKGELEGYDGAAFKTIATDLGHLHTELGKDQIDGKKVGKLLVKLGKETASCSKTADGKNDQIGELGSLLEKAGHDLDREAVKA
ncbi:MAG: hypothetical protein PVSMB8_16310 [Vulcanimicrobiaceae bacterium]